MQVQKVSKKDHILNTAASLFARNGFFATGVDLVMREAGVSKRTLYKYYPSKTALVLAVIDQYRAAVKENWQSILDKHEMDAEQKLLALVSSAEDWFTDSTFYGCLIISVMSE